MQTFKLKTWASVPDSGGGWPVAEGDSVLNWPELQLGASKVTWNEIG